MHEKFLLKIAETYMRMYAEKNPRSAETWLGERFPDPAARKEVRQYLIRSNTVGVK